jgi:hypothetical protein
MSHPHRRKVKSMKSLLFSAPGGGPSNVKRTLAKEVSFAKSKIGERVWRSAR